MFTSQSLFENNDSYLFFLILYMSKSFTYDGIELFFYLKRKVNSTLPMTEQLFKLRVKTSVQ